MQFAAVAVLLLAGIYTLPDAGEIPAPEATQQARITKALRALRTSDWETGESAVRELALVGEVALPSIAKRLNKAEAGERLMLLAAVSHMPRGRPLLEQARGDPHAAVSAWASGPPPRRKTDLRQLANRYLDLLALAEEKLRDEADEDLKRVQERPRGEKESPTLEKQRRLLEEQRRRLIEARHERMSDRALAESVQKQRDRVALRFAREGAVALRAGRLAPELTDPVFVVYLGLLREENFLPFYYATTAIVGLGERAVPALEELVTRPNHEARKVLRLLFAVRRDRGRGFYARFGRFRPEVERTMVVLAPTVLRDAELVGFLERAAADEDATVRSAALDGLLALEPPAGREVARCLFDPVRYGRTEFKRAALLMARAGDLDLLEQYAAVDIPVDRSERSKQLQRLRSATMTALRETEGEEIAALGERLLAAGTTQARTLGIDLLREPQRLLAVARTEEDERLVKTAVQRALQRGAPPREALAVLSTRGMSVPLGALQLLRKRGEFAVLVELAGNADHGRRAALLTLAALETLEEEHEAALLKLHAEAPDDDLKRAALAALLPLGTEAVRLRCEEDPREALPCLRGRATAGNAIAFRFPLRRFLASADADRLKTLARVAEALPEPEPGFYADLLEAWDALAEGERMTTKGVDGGAAQQKALLIEALARSQDRTSAARLFDELVTGEQKEPSLILGTLKAAARLVPPEQLAHMLPLLRELVKGEYALVRKCPPPHSDLRARLLHGGINALAYARVEVALDDLCAFVLDPGLHEAAFEWRHQSFVPWASLQALRHFPQDKVAPAFRRALREAESDGRLAALHPDALFTAVTFCREGRERGRRLNAVALALCEVLERLPWEQREVTYERAMALGQLGRYAEAAAAARAGARRKRERGHTAADGFYTPAFLDGRALIWEKLATKDGQQLGAALPQLDGDPFLLNIAGWNLRFDLGNVALAARAQEQAVRRTAGMWHLARDTLAAIRLGQSRPALALDLLDPQRRLPVERRPASRWYQLFRAQAYRMLGNDLAAKHELETAVSEDRRLLPYARGLPEFQDFADVFRQVDEAFFDGLFRLS
ncbi:MAG: hypothetical protein ACYS0K_14605 [Planctomycetota bacterium]